MLHPRIIYEKYVNGDSLTDAEVSEGVEFYRDLDEKLSLCGPVFHLAAVEACRVYIGLKGFQTARKTE